MYLLKIFDYFELYNSKRATLLYVCDKYNLDFDYKLIGRILKNPYYYGHYRGVDDYVWDGGYIDKKRFDKIQTLLKKNVKGRKTKRDFCWA